MFGEQPDGDPHGECAAETHRLEGLEALPEPAYRRLSDLQSGIEDWYSADQMREAQARAYALGYAAWKAEPAGWLESPYGRFRANPLYCIDVRPQSVEWRIPLFVAPMATPEWTKPPGGSAGWIAFLL